MSTPTSVISVSFPTATSRPFTRPTAPRPVRASKDSAGVRASDFALASPTTADADCRFLVTPHLL